MTSRIVNRVPLLRKPSRRHHHYRTNNGLLWALACGYNPDAWQAQLAPAHKEAQQ